MQIDETNYSIVNILLKENPSFQIRSGTKELSSSESFFSEAARDTSNLERASHSSSIDVLRYLCTICTKDTVSMETGGGWSTCVFAANSSKHYCINPDITANEMIRAFLRNNNIAASQLEFIENTSDTALPVLNKLIEIDIALIDGNHSFPIPIIDWHYLDFHIKKGGLLIVDDTQIPAVALLSKFLAGENSYQKVKTIGNTDVFRKISEKRFWGWAGQAFNKIPLHIRAIDSIKGRIYHHFSRLFR